MMIAFTQVVTLIFLFYIPLSFSKSANYSYPGSKMMPLHFLSDLPFKYLALRTLAIKKSYLFSKFEILVIQSVDVAAAAVCCLLQ